jgi:hypothetical protein
MLAWLSIGLSLVFHRVFVLSSFVSILKLVILRVAKEPHAPYSDFTLSIFLAVRRPRKKVCEISGIASTLGILRCAQDDKGEGTGVH